MAITKTIGTHKYLPMIYKYVHMYIPRITYLYKLPQLPVKKLAISVQKQHMTKQTAHANNK